MKKSTGTNLRLRLATFQLLSLRGRHVLAVICFLFLLGVSPDSTMAQSATAQQDSVILVTSWKRGNAKVTEQVLSPSLRDRVAGRDQVAEYEFDIKNVIDSKKHFKLRLVATVEHTLRTPGLPCWSADFREVTKDKGSGGNLVGSDLLSVEGPGVGDNFPREEWAGHFCPIEKPNQIYDGHFYPIRAERRFLIEDFWLSIKVTDYQYDRDKGRLKKLDFLIEFKNRENDQLSLSGTSPHSQIERRPAKRN